MTCGLLSLLRASADGHTRTCEGGGRDASRRRLRAPPPRGPAAPFHHRPWHYLQHDNWSCGYRNLQMLVSSLLPSLAAVFPGGVPGIEQIQRATETSWRRGCDLTNADHHAEALLGKKAWIGTTEVW